MNKEALEKAIDFEYQKIQKDVCIMCATSDLEGLDINFRHVVLRLTNLWGLNLQRIKCEELESQEGESYE